MSLGLYVQPERHGFDYADEEAVAEQLGRLRQLVLQYKDHPALLSWFIGNELDLNSTNDDVFRAVESISSMIHDIDPLHPTTTTITQSEPRFVRKVMSLAPSLDFISLQLYGALAMLPEDTRRGLNEFPLVISEWGPLGHWESSQTAWKAPIEETSTEKARRIREDYEDVIRPLQENILGSYVFYWGQKQERTSTWFSMIVETGETSAMVDTMQFLWTGNWPKNRAPFIRRLTLDGQRASQDIVVRAGREVDAVVQAGDPDRDELAYRWSVRKESTATSEGGDYEENIPEVENLIQPANSDTVKLSPPSEPGPYRVFVYVYDQQGHVAYGNIPFIVSDNF